MTTIGMIGAGEMGSQIGRAAIACGYNIVIANFRAPDTLVELVTELGPRARAETAAGVAMAGDVIVIAAPLKRINDIPVEGLAGKIVLDTNNYMAWRDGAFDPSIAVRKPFTKFVKSTLPKRKS